MAPACAHGCPACPHTVIGPVTSGSPTVRINGQPAARVGDVGTHTACCGPNTFRIEEGDSQVLIDGKPAARIGDKTKHCGGAGKLVAKK
ncbi:MAG: PAAR domain-containing protein [Armatimonadetes bacterium]|nr:PAAR domain-containing protein [Armatimonadota bacterium]